MKIQKILFTLACAFVCQLTIAAELSVISEIKNTPIKVSVRYENRLTKKLVSQTVTINNAYSKKYKFSSKGANPFVNITWFEGPNIYSVQIPSSGTMLMGTFVIWGNGVFSINFDKSGASNSKLQSYQTQPVPMPS